MKRLAIEVPYERFWVRFFGRYADRVRVEEGVKCFKCDSEGFALICTVRLLGGVTLADLKRSGLIDGIETLYEGKDGSQTIFFFGHYPPIREGRQSEPRVFQAEPPEFVDANRLKYVLVGEEKELQAFLHRAERGNLAPKILSLTQVGPKTDTIMSSLTPRQRQVLVAAFGLGYYDIPKKVSSGAVAKLLKMDKSTLAEHLRKAERKMIKGVIAG
jgi:DNA-binding MarR family transcriptional regulator